MKIDDYDEKNKWKWIKMKENEMIEVIKWNNGMEWRKLMKWMKND